MRFLFPFLASASLLVLSSCDPIGPSDIGSPSGTLLGSGSYHVSADGKAIVVDLGYVYCKGSTLTRASNPDSTPFTLDRNTLTITTAYPLGGGSLESELQTLKLRRITDGNTLEGTWVEQSESYGWSPAGDTNAADDTILKQDSVYNLQTTDRQWLFTADSAYSYGNVQAARLFLLDWNSELAYQGDSIHRRLRQPVRRAAHGPPHGRNRHRRLLAGRQRLHVFQQRFRPCDLHGVRESGELRRTQHAVVVRVLLREQLRVREFRRSGKKSALRPARVPPAGPVLNFSHA